MILRMIKWCKDIILGSSRSITNEIARVYDNFTGRGASNWRPPVFSSQQQVRVLLYRECDWRGRKLLFDSKTVIPKNQKTSEASSQNSFGKPTSPALSKESFLRENKHKCLYPENSKENYQNPFFYEYLKPSPDVKMLGEMIFGSVAMSFHGTSMKVHTIRSPPQLMMSFVFPTPPVGSEKFSDLEGGGSLQSSTSEIQIASKFEQINVAHSVPVDVPGRFECPSGYESDSLRSMNSNASTTTSVHPLLQESQGSSLTHSNSYNSFQRRWLRNVKTNLESGLAGAEQGDHPSYNIKLGRRRVKLGLSVIISFSENNSEELNNFNDFFFSHITIIESHVNKLVETVAAAYLEKNFVHAVYEGIQRLRRSLQDLYTSPRLPRPVWLSMVSPTSNHHQQCQRLMSEFISLIGQYDTKQTHFFVSTLLTAVLTHHLSWVCTVTPSEGKTAHNIQRKEAADWLDMLAKSHPYNPLWMQLGDLYGAVGFPTKLTRTIVTGKKSSTILKLLYIISYFIRCSDVYEKVDHETVDVKSCLFKSNMLCQTFNGNNSTVPSLEKHASKSTSMKENVLFMMGDTPLYSNLNRQSDKSLRTYDTLPTVNDSTCRGDSLGYGSLGDSTDTPIWDSRQIEIHHESCHCTNHERNSLEVATIAMPEHPFNLCTVSVKGEVGQVEDLKEEIVISKTGTDECDRVIYKPKELKQSGSDVGFPRPKLSAEKTCETLRQSNREKESHLEDESTLEEESVTQESAQKTKLYIQGYRNLRFPSKSALDDDDLLSKTLTESVDFVKALKIEKTDTEPEEGYQSLDDMIASSSLGPAITVFNRQFPAYTKELPLPTLHTKGIGEAQTLCNGFGWSLVASISDHYMSDFCLQGLVGSLSDQRMYEDLTAAVQTPVLGEPISSAVCIVADTENWKVNLCSSTGSEFGCQKMPVSMAPLVAAICDSIFQMSQLNMSSEFCLMHLEDRLQELFFRSQALATFLREEMIQTQCHEKPFSILEKAASLLNIDMLDLPLLVSIASTHTPLIGNLFQSGFNK